MTSQTYEPVSGLCKREDIQMNPVTITNITERCARCGRVGDVIETDYYDPVLDRDTTEYQCRDYKTCLDIQFAGTVYSPLMLIICSWCKKVIGTKDGEGQPGISHSMCLKCFDSNSKGETANV